MLARYFFYDLDVPGGGLPQGVLGLARVAAPAQQRTHLAARLLELRHRRTQRKLQRSARASEGGEVPGTERVRQLGAHERASTSAGCSASEGGAASATLAAASALAARCRLVSMEL